MNFLLEFYYYCCIYYWIYTQDLLMESDDWPFVRKKIHCGLWNSAYLLKLESHKKYIYYFTLNNMIKRKLKVVDYYTDQNENIFWHFIKKLSLKVWRMYIKQEIILLKVEHIWSLVIIFVLFGIVDKLVCLRIMLMLKCFSSRVLELI